MSIDLIKQDQNLLNNAIWLVNERLDPFKKYVYEYPNGKYVLTCGEKPPDSTDGLYLLSMMNLCEKQRRKTVITKRSHMVQMCGFAQSKKNFDRIWESLERWKNVTIKFDGCFYTGKNYTSVIFGIIDWAKLDEKTKELSFKFNDIFYDLLQQSHYYRLIDFGYYKSLKRPVSRRLYELMIKYLDAAEKWECDANKLGEKLTLEKRKESHKHYPSDILIKIKPAIAEINKSMDHKIKLEVRLAADGEKIFVFTKEGQTQRPNNSDSTAIIARLKKEAEDCIKKCHGSCGATWANHHQHKLSSSCYHCRKFKESRRKIEQKN